MISSKPHGGALRDLLLQGLRPNGKKASAATHAINITLSSPLREKELHRKWPRPADRTALDMWRQADGRAAEAANLPSFSTESVESSRLFPRHVSVEANSFPFDEGALRLLG
jgi:hypothetical protein